MREVTQVGLIRNLVDGLTEEITIIARNAAPGDKDYHLADLPVGKGNLR